MRVSLFRRTAVAASAAASLALLLTACGGEEKKNEDTGKADAAASASAAAKPDAKALTAPELEKLIVAQADLKGYQVQKAKAADVVNVGDVGADKAACEPLAEAMSAVSTGTPGASAQRKAVEVKKEGSASPDDILGALGAPVTSVTLGSYAGEGAQQAFASLKTAGTECAHGFTISVSGEKTKVVNVAPEPMTAGDEALGFTVISQMEGKPFMTTLVVFRKDNNLATFGTMSLTGKVKQLPKAVIDAQAAKLR
ncbi:hypothetical protein ACIGEZ_14580 [Streptomyces sp. NPDC085481]|uniref:hypothetical protein n=1 Tax=Streptomyces sp. NPDC085481 TaxID=3365727 RepID=UPI0037D5E41F